MPFHTAFLEPEKRPNLLHRPVVYGVFEGDALVAYCLKKVDADYVQAALEYVEKNVADFVKQFNETPEQQS